MQAHIISDVIVKLEEIMDFISPSESLDIARCYVELFALHDYFVNMLNDMKYAKD